MDYLLGKISARGHENIRMVLSDVTAYPDVGVTREIQFNDERKLQDGEWFCIDRFSRKSYFIDYPFFHYNSVSYADVSRDDYERIRYFRHTRGLPHFSFSKSLDQIKDYTEKRNRVRFRTSRND